MEKNMASEKDLLFPAFQKFYSALSSLERFRKENSFFDNISSLDTFFSEFRNITFVLKKSLAHTAYMPIYEKLRSKYLSDLKWFVETRNQTSKEQPFDLIKCVEITAYMPWCSFEILEKKYTVYDDKPLTSIIDETKKFLDQIHPIEVFFSARFSFFKQGFEENIFEKIPQGIKTMLTFLEEFYDLIPKKSLLVDETRSQIEKKLTICIRQDIFLVNDYVYYPAKNEFELVNRWEFIIGSPFGAGKKTTPRIPVKDGILGRPEFVQMGKNNFERFVFLHVALRTQQELTPAFMLIFQDNTCEIDTFQSDNKTTLYRKIHETAQQILSENVKEVFFEYSMISIANTPSALRMTAKERQRVATEEWLVLLKIDHELNEEEYEFYVPGLKCPGYIRQQFLAGSRKELRNGRANMQPIIEAFKKKIDNNRCEAGELQS